ncbi:TPA: erythromycin resistance leader peptide [Streptococcus agalactiae]
MFSIFVIERFNYQSNQK